MQLNNESLRDFDALFKECLEKAHKRVQQRQTSKERVLREIADQIREEIDRTRMRFSRSMYHMDMAMSHKADSAQKRHAYHEFLVQQKPQTLTDEQLLRKFVQKNAFGYQVWDQQMHSWITFPENSEIHAKVTRAPGSNIPVVDVKANDFANGKQLRYTNSSILSMGNNAIGIPVMDEHVHNREHHMQHVDSWFNTAAFGNEGVSRTAGALQTFFEGQSKFRNPETFLGKALAEGQWKMKSGEWLHIKNLELENSSLIQRSVKANKGFASQGNDENLKIANGMKWAGKVTFVISLGFSEPNVGTAIGNNDFNKKEGIKNNTDIVMSVIAFVPVYGWVVSGTYFVKDIEGTFKGLHSSGFNTEHENISQGTSRKFAKNKQEETTFEFNMESIRENEVLELKKQQLKAQDRTYIAPRTLFKTGF